MSKSKAIHNRLEEIFSAAEPVSPEPFQPRPVSADDATQHYTYLDAAMVMDRELARIVEIGRALSQLDDMDVLIRQAAGMIRQQFDLYSVQIYLLEPSQGLVLRAVAGVASRDISRRDRHHPMDAHSVVGLAVATEKPVIIHDTQNSEVFQADPFLPDTCCELALPLLSAQRVFGVLDLYLSDQLGFFPGRETVFEVLAGRLAATIEKFVADALKVTVQTTITPDGRTRRLSQVRLGWEDFLDAIHRKDHVGFVYQGDENETVTEAVEPF